MARRTKKLISILLSILIIITVFPLNSFAEGEPGSYVQSGYLLDGGFEEQMQFTESYKQYIPDAAKPWQTTAYEKKIELFRKNNGVYIRNVILAPSKGEYAAELNADEESSLYQIVNTEPSSLYEWGLDHGARTSSETMALVIGPNQPYAPSKSWGEGYDRSELNSANPTLKTGYKYGRDQMMQMVDWLKATGHIGSTSANNGIANGGKAIILYSKKFGANGTFADNADNQPFSMEPSPIYTEKWYIWLMTDHNTTTSGETNPWGHYGCNGDSSAGEGSIDLSRYYLYTVPSAQTKTLFAFTSVDNQPSAGANYPDPTFGNFIDDVNFRLYRLLSGSSTYHGSVIIKSSDGSGSEEGASSGHEVTAGNSVSTYVKDGQPLEIKAVIKADEKANVRFAGAYCTIQNTEGTGSTTSFISTKDDGTWQVTQAENGDLVYTHTLSSVKSAISLHFIFIKNPLITYDVNGGKPYKCTENGSNVSTEPDYIYSFMPAADESGIKFISPYTSHEPEGLNDGWKFMGWKMFDDNGERELLPGVHTIACNYRQEGTESLVTTQNFLIIEGNNTFTKTKVENTETSYGVEWSTDTEPVYNYNATGLSFVAQWRWRQVFVPQTDSGTGVTDSDTGGTVSVTSVTAEDDENYNGAYTAKGAKAYFAGENETVIASATANSGYYFDGWYDEDGNQVASTQTLQYVQSKESVKTYYARFVKQYTQRFIRQIKDGDKWINLEDDDTEVPVLDHASYEVRPGTVVSSTASNNSAYGVKGWYNEEGNAVDASMISNDGKTLRYSVTGNATYYVRYEKAVRIDFKMQYVDTDGSITSSDSYGSLSKTSVDAIPGDIVKSKAYPNKGYKFIGWFTGEDASAPQVNDVDSQDPNTITPQATSDPVKTYYARFAPRTDTKYVVNHIFKGFDNDNDKKISYTYYGTTGETVTPSALDPATMGESYVGYTYVNGITSGKINASGTTAFNLNYTKQAVNLKYDINKPDGASGEGGEGSVDDTSGYAGWNVKVSGKQFTLSGYTFNGWNTKPDGSGIEYSPGDNYLMLPMEGEQNPNVLYAQWAAPSSVKYTVKHIKLDKNGYVKAQEKHEYYGKTNELVTISHKNYPGYTYQAGYNDEEHTTVASGNILEDGSLVLTLYYTPDPDNLTYKANGGNGADDIQTGVTDETVTVKDGSVFTRAGYTFTGWKTPGGTEYSAGSDYTLKPGDDILIAQWRANSDTTYRVIHYTVSSDGMSSTQYKAEDFSGTTNSTVKASPIPIEGYEYRANLNANGMMTVHTGVIAGDGSLVLKLYYVPKMYKLTYKANGGIGTETFTEGYYRENVSILDNMFTREGYTFTGWNTDINGSSEGAYNPSDSYTYGSSDAILYAQWKANTDTKYKVEHYKVSVDGKSAVLDSTETLTGTTDTIATATAKTISGYTYVSGFDNGADISEVKSGTITGDGKLVLKLYYKSSASLIYKANGGTGADVTRNGVVNQVLTVENNFFTRANYSFSGWNTSADGSGDAYTPGNQFKLTAGTNILYAQWIGNTTKLVYKANGGTGADVDESGPIGTALSVKDNLFVRDGYTFRGWNTKADGTGISYAPSSLYVLTEGENVLYAQWEAIPVIPGYVETTLTYKPNGGSGSDVTVNGIAGDIEKVKDNPFSKEGFTFTGWNTKADGTGVTYTEGSEYVLTEIPGVLYAQWEKIPEPVITTLTYEANGGKGKAITVSGEVGTAIKVKKNPFRKEGYVFIGWNTAPGGDGVSYAVGSEYILTEGDDILYAQWEEETKEDEDNSGDDNNHGNHKPAEGMNAGSNGNGTGEESGQIAKTGDSSGLVIWLSLLIAASLALITALIRKRKYYR